MHIPQNPTDNTPSDTTQMAMDATIDADALDFFLKDANTFIVTILPQIMSDIRKMDEAKRYMDDWIKDHAFRFTYKDMCKLLNEYWSIYLEEDDEEPFDDTRTLDLIGCMIEERYIREINDERNPEPTATFTLTREVYCLIEKKIEHLLPSSEGWETWL